MAHDTKAALPSGVVTFLFTDIEGSTRRWEADAPAMRAALEDHDRTLREAVQSHRGRLFKHTGDGVCAAFESPRDAVAAAVAAQRVLALPVRMGMATGEAEHRDGDYFGSVLNRAARVMACGHGGQILLDDVTAGLLSGVELVDLGPRRLRDLAKPVRIAQVRADGLRADFPPLKTADPAVGNLRRQTTSFVGRASALAEVQQALESHRLVTLTGVGGVGKTRLAIEVAANSASSFPDGVWLVELAAVGDPAAVPEAVAAVLGITQQQGMSVAESVAAALEGRSRLLVFDNCEHVVDAAADIIEAILSRSATVRILATSRQGLRLADEQLWPVPSLDIQRGVESSAVKLFIQRATALAPETNLTAPRHADAVIEICRRLDGIPLAIELAASRVLSMTVTELRDRLDDRFRLLVGSGRGSERHQTLRHAVQWSYDMLTGPEKSLLAKCSVFAGGFDLDAACFVAGSADELATLDLLDGLVRKSLVTADRTSSRTRFSMLETIRQFGEEQLAARNEANAVRTAHARYFADRECDVLALWDSSQQVDAYAWFNRELANLRAAFRWVADRGDLDSACAIAIYATILGFWVEQHEPTAWAEELIEAAAAAEHPRLAQLYVMASQCYAAGRVEQSHGYAQASRVAVASGRFDPVPYDAECWVGGGYIMTGRHEDWVDLCREVLQRGPNRHPHAHANLVMALVFAGRYDEAIAASDGLLAAAGALENPHMASYGFASYGFAFSEADPAAAYDALRRGLEIARASGNRRDESIVAVSLARLATAHGQALEGLESLDLAIRNLYESGSFSIMAGPLALLVHVLDQVGHYEEAATISGFAQTPFTRTAFPEVNSAVIHLCEVLGEGRYQASADVGANMTSSAAAAYAFAQIDNARERLLTG